MPAPSWPRIAGNTPSGSAPDRVNSSVWQMPVALISTRTSPAFGPSKSTSWISSGFPAATATAARTFMVQLPLRSLYSKRSREAGWHLPLGVYPSHRMVGLGRQLAGCLREMGRDRVHQRRRQAIIRLEPKLLQTSADRAHVARLRGTGLDDRGHERRELRLRPALVLRQLGVHEIEPIERMPLVLDPAIHVHAAAGAGIALDRRARVDDLQLVGALCDLHLVFPDHGDDGERRARRLPALGA